MRVLILSYYFPPYNSMGAVRVGKTAKYLTQFGHDVRVITADNPRIEQTGDISLPVEIPEDAITRTRWWSANVVGERLLRRTIRDREKLAADGRVTSVTSLRRSLRSVTHFGVSAINIPDPYIGWYPYAKSACMKLIKSWRPDVILASGGPPIVLMTASSVSRRFKIPWIAELRDLWSDSQAYSYQDWRKWIDRRLERRTLSTARGLVTVSEPLAETLRQKYAVPTLVVTNGFDACDYNHNRTDVNSKRLELAYTGKIYPGKQDLSPLFEAVQMLPEVTDQVHVSLYLRSDIAPVRQQVDSFGLSACVRICKPVPYQESLRIQSMADVLVMATWLDPSQRGIYLGKFFEYVGARRPILAVGPSNEVVGKAIRKHGLGMATSDPAEIGKALMSWCDQKESNGSIPSPADTQTDFFSRENQTRILEKFLLEICEAKQTKV